MATFSLYWSVSNVSHTKDFATRRNIRKPVLFPRYKGRVGNLDTVSAYIGSSEIEPSSNLNVIRVEDSVSENSRSAFSGDVFWTGNTGYSTARYFLLTDVIGDYVSRDLEPLYWKHVLPSGDIEPDSVAILDSELNEVDSDSYITERIEARTVADVVVPGSYESCSVFSNYTNSYDKETGELEIYFVRYTASGTSHYQILNPQPAFDEATIDDISAVTGHLKPWRKVYLLVAGSSVFTVTTPGISTDYYLTPLERSRIVVREPIDRDDNLPWFVNVSNGSFRIVRNSLSYTYSLPEFATQTFSPLYPYKVEVEEIAEYLRPDLISVDRNSLQVDDGLYIMDVIVRNVNGNALYALTTDVAKDGDYYEEAGERIFRVIETDNAWVSWDASGIAGWDTEGGFIHLKSEYPDTCYFYVTYYYKETGYEVSSLNVNPIFDEEYNGQSYVIYIVPVGGSNPSGLTSSVEYLKVDRSGRVVEASQDGSTGALDISSQSHVGEQYMYYSLQASTTGSCINGVGQDYVEVTDYSEFPSAGILYFEDPSGNPVYAAYNGKESNRFYFETYTLVDVLPIGTVFTLHSFDGRFTTSSDNTYQWLVLAEITTDSTSRVDELSVIDLRMPGGVVKDKYKDEALAIDSRAIWARPEIVASRGQPTPGDSAAIVKVPYTILKEYGGTFTQDQVFEIVARRHLATGIVPVVIYHGAVPNISSVASTTDTVTVCWDSEGEDYSYNVYYASLEDGPWTLASLVAYSDQIYGNCYTIQGLTSSLIYYIAISSIDSDGVEGPKSTPWGVKTRSS